MKKNEKSPYDIFVKKLEAQMGKTLLRADLSHLWLQSGGSKLRCAYALGKAKNSGWLVHYSGGIFRVTSPESISESDSIDPYYWDIVYLLIQEHAPSGAIIAHEKSMELHLRNFEIPETIVLYTRHVAKRIQIGPYRFQFRTLQSGEKTKYKNMYNLLMQLSKVITIDNHTFHTLGIEASLLDIASLKIHDNGISENLIIRFIQKYEKSYSREILGKLVSNRYIRAMNRVRSLAKLHGFSRLYDMSLDIIKKEGGGCYVTL